jgi:hypothetical protein
VEVVVREIKRPAGSTDEFRDLLRDVQGLLAAVGHCSDNEHPLIFVEDWRL